MENMKPLQDEGTQEESQKVEEKKPIPFGAMGITFLMNLTQYAVFLGITVGLLALIKVFGPK